MSAQISDKKEPHSSQLTPLQQLSASPSKEQSHPLPNPDEESTFSTQLLTEDDQQRQCDT